jgi:hypothetical protein
MLYSIFLYVSHGVPRIGIINDDYGVFERISQINIDYEMSIFVLTLVFVFLFILI